MNEQETGLKHLELYHVELQGKCFDSEQGLFTGLMQEFAKKFANFVELEPVTLSSISQIDQI